MSEPAKKGRKPKKDKKDKVDKKDKKANKKSRNNQEKEHHHHTDKNDKQKDKKKQKRNQKNQEKAAEKEHKHRHRHTHRQNGIEQATNYGIEFMQGGSGHMDLGHTPTVTERYGHYDGYDYGYDVTGQAYKYERYNLPSVHMPSLPTARVPIRP